MTGRDEDRLVKETKNAKGTDKNKTTFSLGIFMRVDLIDGKPPTLADIQGLGLSDRNLLREEFQEIEGGLDTEVDLQCPDCEHDFAREVDVTQAGFFFPSATRKSSKTKRSI
jgi:hypothetical protein